MLVFQINRTVAGESAQAKGWAFQSKLSFNDLSPYYQTRLRGVGGAENTQFYKHEIKSASVQEKETIGIPKPISDLFGLTLFAPDSFNALRFSAENLLPNYKGYFANLSSPQTPVQNPKDADGYFLVCPASSNIDVSVMEKGNFVPRVKGDEGFSVEIKKRAWDAASAVAKYLEGRLDDAADVVMRVLKETPDNPANPLIAENIEKLTIEYLKQLGVNNAKVKCILVNMSYSQLADNITGDNYNEVLEKIIKFGQDENGKKLFKKDERKNSYALNVEDLDIKKYKKLITLPYLYANREQNLDLFTETLRSMKDTPAYFSDGYKTKGKLKEICDTFRNTGISDFKIYVKNGELYLFFPIDIASSSYGDKMQDFAGKPLKAKYHEGGKTHELEGNFVVADGEYEGKKGTLFKAYWGSQYSSESLFSKLKNPGEAISFSTSSESGGHELSMLYVNLKDNNKKEEEMIEEIPVRQEPAKQEERIPVKMEITDKKTNKIKSVKFDITPKASDYEPPAKTNLLTKVVLMSVGMKYGPAYTEYSGYPLYDYSSASETLFGQSNYYSMYVDKGGKSRIENVDLLNLDLGFRPILDENYWGPTEKRNYKLVIHKSGFDEEVLKFQDPHLLAIERFYDIIKDRLDNGELHEKKDNTTYILTMMTNLEINGTDWEKIKEKLQKIRDKGINLMVSFFVVEGKKEENPASAPKYYNDGSEKVKVKAAIKEEGPALGLNLYKWGFPITQKQDAHDYLIYVSNKRDEIQKWILETVGLKPYLENSKLAGNK